jgi:hypothetical protein
MNRKKKVDQPEMLLVKNDKTATRKMVRLRIRKIHGSEKSRRQKDRPTNLPTKSWMLIKWGKDVINPIMMEKKNKKPRRPT